MLTITGGCWPSIIYRSACWWKIFFWSFTSDCWQSPSNSGGCWNLKLYYYEYSKKIQKNQCSRYLVILKSVIHLLQQEVLLWHLELHNKLFLLHTQWVVRHCLVQLQRLIPWPPVLEFNLAASRILSSVEETLSREHNFSAQTVNWFRMNSCL